MCCGRNCPALLLAGSLAVLICGAAGAQPPEQPVATADQLDRLIQQLDSDSFEAREDAARALRAIGRPALAALEKARGHKSLEVRWRARAIAEAMTAGVRLRDFTAFAALPDDKLDLEQGMWLIARILDPDVKKQNLTRQLDELADLVRKKLGKGVDPATADPQVVVAAVRQALHVEKGFTGNVDDYNNPDNSSLARVLESRKGLPILLSHVTVAACRRLKVPIVGVPASGRYLIKYDGSKAPAGFPKDDIYINPFEDFHVLPSEAAAGVAVPLDTPREALTRMLRNLLTDLESRGQPDQLQQAQELFDLLEAHGPATE
jgi:regulator of sirC expression with transglutaminase-like and TPR domain